MRSGLRDCAQADEIDYIRPLTDCELNFVLSDWEIWARDDQLPPEGDWTTWLLLGGRGAGKTRAGAEWVSSVARHDGTARIALIGETLGDARSVMVEGVSGLMSVYAGNARPDFEPSRRLVTWPSGAVAQLFSAEDPDALRGPQFSHAWADELAKWRRGEETWDMLQFGLRLGARPRQVVTTTPRNVRLLKRLIGEAGTVVSRARTEDNASNLAPSFLGAVVGRYRGTRLGRQELDAELLEDRPDALWSRAMLETARVAAAPALTRIVVAVDPPVTSGAKSDACGIVVAGRGADGRAYVLEDATIGAAGPMRWARAAVSAFHRYEADRIVAEVNQGGEMVATVLRQVDACVPVRSVRATRAKWLRAEPVAALYEQGRVSHAGAWPALEDEMCDFGRDGMSDGRSPDRLDALVWALTDLMLRDQAEPRVRVV